MHTVELLAHALDLAARLGYKIRQEWLGGTGGGACELKGRKILFLDLALGPAEQLEMVLDVLRREPASSDWANSALSRESLLLRKSA